MKLRKIMAALVAAAVATSVTVSVASAKEVWSGSLDVGTSWSSYVEVPGLSPSAGQILTIEFSINAGEEGKLIVKDKTNGWPALEAHKNSTHAGYNGDVIVLGADETSVSYVLTESDAANIKDTALIVAGYGITIKSVDISDPAPASVETAGGAFKADCAYSKDAPSASFQVVDDIKEVKVSVAIKPAGAGFDGFNDWCGEGVRVTYADGTTKYYQWGGAQVTWGWDIDDDKVDDSVGGVKGSTWLGTVSNNAVELTIPVAKDAVVDFYCLSWDTYADTQFTINVDGGVSEVVADSTETETPVVTEPTVEETEPTVEETEPTEEEVYTEEVDEDTAEAGDVDLADYFDGGTLYLVRDDGGEGYIDATGADLTEIYGVKFNVTFDEAEVADDAVWVGGGVGPNSNSTGWEMHEWGKASGEKEITPNFENGTIIWYKGEPIFTDAEEYAQLWIQSWGGALTVDSVELLYADYEAEVDNGDVSAPVTEEANADNGEASADKGNPDTGVAGVAVAAGVVALAGAAIVVSRKRK